MRIGQLRVTGEGLVLSEGAAVPQVAPYLKAWLSRLHVCPGHYAVFHPNPLGLVERGCSGACVPWSCRSSYLSRSTDPGLISAIIVLKLSGEG